MPWFNKGDRVRPSPSFPSKDKNKTGRVASRQKHESYVSVVWDGFKTPSTYHSSFIERIEKD